jgi:hypothetical protein
LIHFHKTHTPEAKNPLVVSTSGSGWMCLLKRRSNFAGIDLPVASRRARLFHDFLLTLSFMECSCISRYTNARQGESRFNDGREALGVNFSSSAIQGQFNG